MQHARHVGAALAALLLLAASASAAWRQTTFVIGGYMSPGDAQGLVLLNDAGIDLVVPANFPDPAGSRRIARTIDSLRVARQGFHLRDLVYEEVGKSPRTLFKNLDPVANRAAILRELQPSSGLNDESVAGWLIWDEPPLYYPNDRAPRSRIFDAIHEMTRILRDSTNGAGTSNKLALVNLFPGFVTAKFPLCSPDPMERYRCYLDEYLSQFDRDPLPAPVLSFDMYPFETPAAYPRYFTTLAAVRDAAAHSSRDDYRIPFWSVIQASPRRDRAGARYRSTPTFPQIRWQAYVSLAYGARGIFYWTLAPVQGAPEDPGYGVSFLRKDGTRNGALYDSLATLDRELRQLDPTLLELEPVATAHASANGFLLPPGEESRAAASHTVPVNVTGGNQQGMVGRFRMRSGDDYVLVVNKDTKVARSFTVTLGARAVTVDHFEKTSGRLIPVSTNSSSFRTGSILPGSGELFRLVLGS